MCNLYADYRQASGTEFVKKSENDFIEVVSLNASVLLCCFKTTRFKHMRFRTLLLPNSSFIE